MAIKKQSPRIKHHSLTSAGVTFSIPLQEDFTITGTTMSWTPTDLANREIGVNTTDKKAYIRLSDEIKEFVFYPLPSGVTGSQGIQGVTGPQGPQGATGPQGPSGECDCTNTVTFTKVVVENTPNGTRTLCAIPITEQLTTIEVLAIAVPNDGTVSAYSCKLFGSFLLDSGTVTQVGTVTKDEKAKAEFETTTIGFAISGVTVEVRATIPDLELSGIAWTVKYILNTND